MRILFLTQGKTAPASRFRVEQYIPYLKKEGIKCSVSHCWPDRYYLPRCHKKKIVGWWIVRLFFLLKFINRLLAVMRGSFYDIVFLQRDLLPLDGYPLLELLARKLNKKIVFDFDDAIYVQTPRKIPEIIKMSDYVITGNKNLKEYAHKYSSHIEIIPTPVDTSIYRAAEKRDKTKEIVVGWMGSSSGIINLDIISTALRNLSQMDNFCFRLVSDFLPDFSFLKGLKIDFRKWSAEKELSDLRSFDIGIMPLKDNEFNRGKCGFKALLYMACGIPVIASPVGFNREIVKDGENGFLAGSGEEWFEKLSLLVGNKVLREKLGRMGRKTVEERYSVRVNLPKLISVFKMAKGLETEAN